MGYYDPNGFYVYEEADVADPGAGFSELLNLASRAFPPAVANLVRDALSSDPEIRAAAILALEDALANGNYTPRKCFYKENGSWIRTEPGAPTATHYGIPDHTGSYVIRQTPWPVPGPNNTFIW